MALTKCNECGGQLSDRAMACPHCGAPARRQRRVVAAAMLAVVASLAVGLMTATSVREGAGDERVAAPIVVAGLIATIAVVMGIVALVRGTRR